VCIGVFEGYVAELLDGGGGGAIAGRQQRRSERRLSWQLGENG
jgi:hypothetical protein